MKGFITICLALAFSLTIACKGGQELIGMRPAKIIVNARGSANSSLRPDQAELFQMSAENAPTENLTIVPAGKKLVVPDFLIKANNLSRDIVVNVNQRIEDKSAPNYKASLPIQQVPVKAGESKQINLGTGFVVHAGNGIVAVTNAGIGPNHVVQIDITGYLIDEGESL
ncbi:MAG: hypothetical protein WBO10_11870 [Pyrinomonadaceae bacterium]